MNILPIYRSHYSRRSILTLDEPKRKDSKGNFIEYPVSVFDLVLDSKQDFVCIADNCMTGFLEASKYCEANKLKLIFGLRTEITKDIVDQDEKSLKSRATYIIFAKNRKGYDALIKIASCAAKAGFYYNPCIDFTNLKRLWTPDLILAVSFYDSFLHLNSLEGYYHLPEFDTIKPIFLLENNDIPFDEHLRAKVLDFCAKNKFETLESQTIYYKKADDFIAYMTYRCIQARTTIEKPELNHFCSDTFNYERWKKNNE